MRELFEFGIPPESIDGFSYAGSLNGHYYYYYLVSSSWTAAYDICNNAGGYLPVITSSEENDFLLSISSSLPGEPHVWIGLTDETTEGTFEWINGELLDYTNWDTGEPNNRTGEDYVIMHSSNHTNPGSWNDSPNSINYPFLMEIDYEVQFVW